MNGKRLDVSNNVLGNFGLERATGDLCVVNSPPCGNDVFVDKLFVQSVLSFEEFFKFNDRTRTCVDGQTNKIKACQRCIFDSLLLMMRTVVLKSEICRLFGKFLDIHESGAPRWWQRNTDR